METAKFKDNLVWRTDQRIIGQKQLLEEHTKAIAQIEKTNCRTNRTKTSITGGAAMKNLLL